jgi:hypothetical protein
MHVTCKHAHQLLETVYEGILMSCSGGEVKLETKGTGVRRSRFAVCSGASGSGDEMGCGSAIEWD